MPPVQTSVFRNPDFRRLFFADTLSQLGAAIAPIALPLVAVTTLHASTFQVGLLTAFETLAFLLVGLPAGAWVDRVRRRTVLVWANIGRAVVLTTIPLLWFVGWLTIYQLLLVALVLGTFTVFFEAAYQSYLPRLIERDQLVEGNARLQAVQSVARVAGPGIAGLLIQWTRPSLALIATVAGYLWAVLCVVRIRRSEPTPDRPSGTHLGREITEGLKFLLRNPVLRRTVACTSSFNFFYMMAEPMLVLLLARNLHLPAGTIGVIFACGGAGGVVGALLVDRIVTLLGRGRALWASAATAGVAGLLAPLAGPSWQLILVGAGQAIAGVALVVYNVSAVSFRQAVTPDRMLGRINAGYRVMVWGSMPLGGLAAGLLGQAIGPRPTLWFASASAALCFLLVYLSPLRSMRELPLPDSVPAPV